MPLLDRNNNCNNENLHNRDSGNSGHSSTGGGGIFIKVGHNRRWSLESQPSKDELLYGKRRRMAQCQNFNDAYCEFDDDFDDDESSFNIQRRRQLLREPKKEDHLSKLPDEMLLKVFSWLPKVALGRLAQVNSRMNRVINDETLWHRIDCTKRILSPEQTKVLFDRKPNYLRLARSAIADQTTFSTSASQLTYLDLSMCEISPTMLNKLLGACPNLHKLSMEHLELSPEVLETAAIFAHSIETLNMTMCYDVDATNLAALLKKCDKLAALNLGCIKQKWTGDDFLNVMNSLPTTLDQLNICGFREQLKDTHVIIMATRCTHLFDLDLSDSQAITMQSMEAVSNLAELQHLALSRCYAIEPQAYSLFTHMKALRYLEIFSLFKEASMAILTRLLPGVKLNQFPLSAIARPTLGPRKSQIWDERVRD